MAKLSVTQEKLIRDLRGRLHACPEISGQERRTKAELMTFLSSHTTLELVDRGSWFYAAHREKNEPKPGIALRADYDALPMSDGAAHLCGHDGHAAALCGTGLLLEGKTIGRNVYLLFQPAEETGAGASACTEIFALEGVKEIYGAHNLPGVALGVITTRPGTFACASLGLILSFAGAPAHAAYPENGISPAPAVGALLNELPQLSAPEKYSGMALCTVIGVQMGEKAFGAAAADAEVWLTLRAEFDGDLASLEQGILDRAETLARMHRLKMQFEDCDVFPATINHTGCAEKVLRTCGGQILQSPMRWSEDFGWYLQKCDGAFFGIGAGEAQAPLHTSSYEYPDDLLSPACEAFYKLVLS
ncbi:MAG: M20/M25/M40 family metallo-hydrolase [Oscillospiraceae bacterium]